jgi:hypothetical protein
MSDIKQNQSGEIRRYELLAGVNRGWRKAEMEMLARIGALDSADNAAVAAMIRDFRRLVVLARFRLVYENAIHAALDQRKPGASGSAANHDQYDQCFARLESMLVGIEAIKGGAARRGVLKTLYLRFSEFIALDFARMASEEQIVRPLLHAMFSDEELAAIEQSSIVKVPADVFASFIKIIAPALDPEGRQELVARLKRYVPAERLDALMRDVVSPAMTKDDVHRLDEKQAA